MATKRSEKTYQKTVQLTLTPEITDQIVYHEANADQLVQRMFDLANKGYAVSFRTSFKPEGVSCSIMPQDSSLPNAGMMLFGNSDNAISALAVVIAKLDFLGVESDWESLTGTQTTRRYS